MKLLRTLLFFPSLTFNIFNAEIFPWAFIYGVIKSKHIGYRLFFIILLMLGSFIFTSIFHNGIFFLDSVRSMFAYLNPLIIFFVLIKINLQKTIIFRNLINKIFIFLIVVGLLQSTGIFSFISEYIVYLIPRSSFANFSKIHGVSLLSTEPSRAAIELIFIYAFIRSANNLKRINKFLLDLFMFIFLVIIIKSMVGLVLYLILNFMYYKLKVLIPILTLVVITSTINIDSRALILFQQIISEISFVDVYNIFLNAAGTRVVSVLSAYSDGLTSLFGNGVGTWSVSSVNAMINIGYDPKEISFFVKHSNSEFVGIRPSAYFANIALDFGIIGMVIYIISFINIFKKYYKNRVTKHLLYLFLFSFFFIGATGNPVPWVLLAISMRYTDFYFK